MVVRIQLIGGFVFTPLGFGMAEVQKNVTARPYRNATVVGYVIQNDFPNRKIQIDYQDTTFPNQHLAVTIPYSRIRVMERQIEGTLVSDAVHRLRIPAYVMVLGIF